MKRWTLILLAIPLLVGACSPAKVKERQGTWIMPGEVTIENYYPGAEATWPFQIHNGKNTAQRFVVVCRGSNRVKKGYVLAPPGFETWVRIDDTEPILMPDETREIKVTLAVPEGADLPSRWEFWVSATGQREGMINIELASRILVNTR